MALLHRLVSNIAILMVMILPLESVADNYLKMLESEAEGVTLDKSGQLKEKQQVDTGSTDGITKTDWAWEGDLQDDVLPQGLAQDEFATLLKQRFYGTFVFYRKLNSVDQQTVYYHYTKTSPAALDSIRNDIMSHLKK